MPSTTYQSKWSGSGRECQDQLGSQAQKVGGEFIVS
jgi:hypothetical protein